MRRIVVRAPTCSADIVTYLRGIFRFHAGELQPGEHVEFAYDADRFPYATAIFESLLTGAGLTLLSTREEDTIRIFEVEKPQHGST